MEVKKQGCMKKNVTFSQGVEALFGTLDENLRYLETAFEVRLSLAQNNLVIEGSDAQVGIIERLITDYDQVRREGALFSNSDLKSVIRIISEDSSLRLRDCFPSGKPHLRQRQYPRSLNQRRYLDAPRKLTWCSARPGSTGKTYLAVAIMWPVC
jgi:phosphate starvation-inducible protein PhoH